MLQHYTARICFPETKKRSDIHSLYSWRAARGYLLFIRKPLEHVDKLLEKIHKVIKISTDIIHKRHTLHHIHLFHLFRYSKFVHIYNNRYFCILQVVFNIFFGGNGFRTFLRQENEENNVQCVMCNVQFKFISAGSLFFQRTAAIPQKRHRL